MKSTIFLLLSLVSSVAHADHWECKGAHNLEKIVFDFGSQQVENLKITAPFIVQRNVEEMFVQQNAFTLVAFDLLDDKAQETIDYTLVIDRAAGKISVFSQWSTNENVDSEVIACKVK